MMRQDSPLRRGIEIWYKLRLPVQLALLVLLLALPVAAVWGLVALVRGPATAPGQTASPAATRAAPRGGEAEQAFVTRVLEETTQSWTAQFRALGRSYTAAAPLTSNGMPDTACDKAPAPSGIFYCTADARIYVDLDRVAQLRQAPGDLAPALLLAHAVGHHVQQQLGMLDLVRSLQPRMPEADGAETLRRRVELQADCFAGLWARKTTLVTGIAEGSAIETALAAISEDTVRPVPPPAASNTAEPAAAAVPAPAAAPIEPAERAKWFRTGLQRGEYAGCDSFAGLL